MKFGKELNGEIHTQDIDRVLMSETELRDLQQIAGPGCWTVTRNGREIQIRVTPDPDEVRVLHHDVDGRTR